MVSAGAQLFSPQLVFLNGVGGGGQWVVLLYSVTWNLPGLCLSPRELRRKVTRSHGGWSTTVTIK